MAFISKRFSVAELRIHWDSIAEFQSTNFPLSRPILGRSRQLPAQPVTNLAPIVQARSKTVALKLPPLPLPPPRLARQRLMSSSAIATTGGVDTGDGTDEAVKNQWRPCAEWLFCCLENVPDILQLAQTVLTDPQATVMDLLSLLKDGILLCHILPALSCNEITLDSLEGFKLMTLNSPFVFKNNILVFLGQCESYFRLKKSELFRAEDLLEQENIIGIIDALSNLSRCPRARQSGIAGFEIIRCSPQAESDYYSFVADSQPEPVSVHTRHQRNQQQQQQQLEQPIDSSGLSSSCCSSQQAEEKVYDCLINLRGAHTMNSAVEQQPPMTQQQQQQPQQQGKGLTATEMCVQEIVDTERSYVDTLRFLVEDIMRPMKTRHSAWSAEEVDEIFKLIPELFALHQKLLQELQISIMLRPEFAQSLPQVFTSFKDRLLIYGHYGGHLPRARKLVENACKCDKRKAEELQQHVNNSKAVFKFKLTDFLTVPMQRVLKYHLMLQNLISLEEKLVAASQQPQQPAPQFDLEQLREAHASMKDVADYINEVKRDYEEIALIDQIQNTIDDLELPSPMRLISYGRLLMDDEIKVANDPNRPASGSKLRHCFLWNRICMLTKSRGPGKDTYLFKNVFAVRTDLVVKAIDCPPASKKSGARVLQQATSPQQQQQQQQSNSKWCWYFSVTDPQTIHNSNSTSATSSIASSVASSAGKGSAADAVNFVFIAKTRESREHWLQAYQRAKDVLAPPNFNSFGHYFEPTTFESPTYCSLCHKLIMGCFYQGYRCRKTGMKVHPACIPAKPSRSQSEIIAPRDHRDGGGVSNTLPASTGIRPASDVTDLSPSAAQAMQPLRIPPPVSEESHGLQPGNGEAGLSRQLSRGLSLDGAQPLGQCDWFVGQMSREQARDCLIGQPVGTFLVRLSKTSSVDYAISLRYRETIKHMRIEQVSGSYYLGEIRTFASVQALVAYYSVNSLCECFTDLDTTLARPYRPTAPPTPPMMYSRSNSQGGNMNTHNANNINNNINNNNNSAAMPQLRTSQSALLGTSTPRRSSIVGYALALTDYSVPGHLSLLAGETIALLGQLQQPGNAAILWRGRRANGSVGVFSPEIVQLVSTPGFNDYGSGAYNA